jgi:hypothetical protein
MGVAFDAAAGHALLFGGGDESGVLRDTWTWNGKNWTQQHPSTTPPARCDMSITYDATRAKIVVFGGVNHDYDPIGDTWTWNGRTWRLR